MNEMGYFQAFWMFIWEYIKKSRVYWLLRKIYDGISGAWKRSAITEFFRRVHISGDALQSSIVGRVLRSPFTFLSYLQRTHGSAIKERIDTSRLVRLGNIYLHNLLALNTRFIGMLLVGISLGLEIVNIVNGVALPLECVLLLVFGGIVSMPDLNLSAYLKGSVILKLFSHFSGIDMTYNFYKERYTKPSSRLILAVIIGLACGAVGGYMGMLYSAVLAVGLFGMFLILKNIRAGVYLTVFLAPLMPTMVMVALVMLCLFSLIVKSITDLKFRWHFEGVGFLILGFLVVYLFASLNSFAVVNSLSILAVYIVFMLFYFVVINTIRTKKQLFDVLTLFVISGTLVCLYGIAQYIFGWDTASAWMDEEMFTDIKMRVYSTLENPNVLGEYILLVLPVCVGLMWQKPNKLSKVLYTVFAGIIFGTLILTFSRGCWIGVVITAGIFVTFVCGKLWGLALIVLPFVPMFIPESIINRFASVGDMTDSSTSYRVYIWFGSLAMIKDFWASGIGPGTEAFQSVYPFYSYSGIVAPHSHNMFLQVFVESGIVGIAVFIAILILFIKKMAVGYSATSGKGSKTGAMIVAIASGVAGFAVQGMFDNCFYNYRVFLVFWFVIALGMAAANIAKAESIENGKAKAVKRR